MIENKKKTSDVLSQKEKKKLQEQRKKRKQERAKLHELKKKIEGGDVDAETLWRMLARNNHLMEQDKSKNKKIRALQCSNDKRQKVADGHLAITKRLKDEIKDLKHCQEEALMALQNKKNNEIKDLQQKL